ncbi:stage V sporulation protein B [Paenibacillus phyllosphaerae]|uniref:Stage V sporulation protein B n=1 Tax=Paenibacillus phyllosphaerae TaxID=274593 RepID=A0A7W5FKX3_9BACL|nr:polysaccharide biosynthesis protein [Paenibacillus phyllosphaerae]MBB3108434.1 stage V sporulation protein B [Paenibacillus phyllosphaerae]
MVKKDSLIKGTIILAAAALVARVLGLFQRVPLDYLMDDAGNTYFNTANNVYLLLLVIATGGIPSAISKMVSERYALGRKREAKQIYKAAIMFGAVTGVVIAVLLFAFAPLYARLADNPGAHLAVAAIAPSLILFPVIAMMRGYFQGRQFMMAGGISQIVEQIARVVTAIALVLIILSWNWDTEWVAAGAAFGSVFGSVGAFVIMLYYARKLRGQDNSSQLEDQPDTSRTLPFKTIYREMFGISVPIVVAAVTVQFVYFFDTSVFYRLTDYVSRGVAEQAFAALGTRAQALAGIPPILAIALSTSIIPIISSAYSIRNMDEVKRQTSLVMRIVVLTGVPAALALTVAAVSATGFFFEDTDGSGLVAALTAGTIFQITMMTTNSVLFGMGKARIPMKHTIIGMLVKVVGSVALAPFLDAYGLIIASTLCFLTISTLNLRVIRQEIPLSVLGKRWTGYIVTVAVAAGVGFIVDLAGRNLLDALPAKVTYLLTLGATGIAALGVYAVLLIVLRVITPEEIGQYPGPMRKLLRPLMRLTARNLSKSK